MSDQPRCCCHVPHPKQPETVSENPPAISPPSTRGNFQRFSSRTRRAPASPRRPRRLHRPAARLTSSRRTGCTVSKLRFFSFSCRVIWIRRRWSCCVQSVCVFLPGVFTNVYLTVKSSLSTTATLNVRIKKMTSSIDRWVGRFFLFLYLFSKLI